MYTSWAHHYVPKFNGCCAFLVNPLFIFCILKDNKLQLGNYRWLLLYFAIFNMACSLCDMLVPVVGYILNHLCRYNYFSVCSQLSLRVFSFYSWRTISRSNLNLSDISTINQNFSVFGVQPVHHRVQM